MADIRIATTTASGLQRLGLHGQAVVAAHRQLAAILGNRLGKAHATLLSRPELGPDGRIDWFAPTPAQPASLLPPSRRASIEVRAAALVADIARLAETMRGEGDSAALVAAMLQYALVTPASPSGGESVLYAAGDQPVLVLWGHASEGQAVPDPSLPRPPIAASSPAPSPASPLTAEASPPTAVASGPAVAAGPEGAAAVDAGGGSATQAAAPASPPQRGWLAWMLPLLLLVLVVWLAWRALQPLPPELVALPAPPAAPAVDPLQAELDREKALRAQLAALSAERDHRQELCEPIMPRSPVSPPPSKTERPEDQPPAKVTEAPPPSEEKAAEAPPPPALARPEPRPAPPPAKAGTPTKPEPAKPEPKLAEPKPATKAPPPDKQPEPEVALAPPKPPAPPRNKCALDVKPGDEPEVVVIVDGSGSMSEPISGAPSRMAAARDSVENMVRGLPPPVDVALIDFSSCDKVRLDRFYSQPQRGQLIGEVRGLQPDRGTPLARSIERAGNIVSADVESTIVVVTDGDDTCGGDPCGAARAIRSKRPNVTINVIDLSGGSSPTPRCIANATGGKVLTPSSTLDMKNKVQQATRLPDARNCTP